ncbi:MAG: hypothetical protein AAB798_02825 [Patescibacteria group bacterium]
MKFDYKRYGKILRPVVPIKVKSGGRSVGYEVLVDSGADICIFDGGIGDILGIDVESGEQKLVGGIAGQSAQYYLHDVEIEVGGWPYKIRAGFLRNVAGGFNYGVVGQTGFFEFFVVKFDLQKAEIELKRKE